MRHRSIFVRSCHVRSISQRPDGALHTEGGDRGGAQLRRAGRGGNWELSLNNELRGGGGKGETTGGEEVQSERGGRQYEEI